jgi:UDP-N-acetyl-D-glucosamine dehydrogenase
MRSLNYKTRFIDLASEVNSSMPDYVVEKVVWGLNEVEKSVKGSHVMILGVAYKRNIDDMRESPALDVMRLLEKRGALVTYHDPHVPSFREDGHEYHSVPLTAGALDAADAVVIVTEHTSVDYQFVADNTDVIIDTRHAMAKLKPSRARIIQLTSSIVAGASNAGAKA